MTIRFRYCPAGTIYPGRPAPVDAATNAAAPTPVRDFYIGETEVTLEQFRLVLGDAGMAPLKVQADRGQKNNPQLLGALQKGRLEPAFFVGLDEATDFCNRLQEAVDEVRRQTLTPPLDTRLFRLPSHVEWQYAARAVQSADDEKEKPHFAQWVRLSQLSIGNQQKCQEVWNSLGHADPFPDNQDGFLELSRTTDASQQEKVKEILAEAFKKAFNSSPRNAAGLGAPQPVGVTRPNSWNLTDVHEGVTEWTLWARDIERTHTLWSRLATARKKGQSLDKQEDVFLAGGSFMDKYFGAKGLNRFTIWGGPKLTEDQPLPFAFQQEDVFEYTPGFRLVMERTLAEDWMLALRHGVFQKGQVSETATDYLNVGRSTVAELSGPEHPARIAIDFYSELMADRRGNSQGLVKALQAVAQMRPAAGAAGSTDTKSKLAAILNKGNEKKADESKQLSSDEEAYFRSLAALMGEPRS